MVARAHLLKKSQTLLLTGVRVGFQVSAAVWSREILLGTEGNNPRRVNLMVRDVVVPLDVIEIDSLRDPIELIQLLETPK